MYERAQGTLTERQILEEWQNRRSATWRATRFWLFIVAICGVTFWYLAKTPANDMTGPQLLATFSVFILLMVAVLAVIFRTQKLFRCPSCNAVPRATWATFGPTSLGIHSGIPLNPEHCSNCGARLRAAK